MSVANSANTAVTIVPPMAGIIVQLAILCKIAAIPQPGSDACIVPRPETTVPNIDIATEINARQTYGTSINTRPTAPTPKSKQNMFVKDERIARTIEKRYEEEKEVGCETKGNDPLLYAFGPFPILDVAPPSLPTIDDQIVKLFVQLYGLLHAHQ